MKRVAIAVVVLALAAPAAWGLYSGQSEPTAPGADPALFHGESPALPGLGLLREVNDWGVRVKYRLQAYLNADQRAAFASSVKRCFPGIGGGFYAKHTSLKAAPVLEATGQLVNLSGLDYTHANLDVVFYNPAGETVGSAKARVEDIPAGASKVFRAYPDAPVPPGAGVWVEFRDGETRELSPLARSFGDAKARSAAIQRAWHNVCGFENTSQQP